MPLRALCRAWSFYPKTYRCAIATGASFAICFAAALACVCRARHRAVRTVPLPDCAAAVLRLRTCCYRPISVSSRTVLWRIGNWFRWTEANDTVVVLRTADPADAALYYALLLPLQRELEPSFEMIVEADPSCRRVVCIGVGTRDFGSNRTRREDGGAALTLCRIPLPDDRVYRHIPPAVPRMIAAHTRNWRLFESFAEELVFYAPYLNALQEYKEPYAFPVDSRSPAHGSFSTMPKAQKELSTHASYPRMTRPVTTPDISAVKVSAANGEGAGTAAWESFSGHNVRRRPLTSPPRCNEEAGTHTIMSALRGYIVDANAIAFSSSLLAELGDMTFAAGLVSTATEDQFIYDTIHEVSFHVVFCTPLSQPDVSAAEILLQHPLELWKACRRSRRAAAELYMIDVVSAKGDAMICHRRVVDEVVAQAVIVHHGGSLLEFADALAESFGLSYVPVTSAMRRVFEQSRRKAINGLSGEGHTVEPLLHAENGLKGQIYSELEFKQEEKDVEKIYREEEEEETEALVFMELPHVCEFLIKHRLDFSSAMLTASGSNKLEEVFGTPATVFPFLLCACESIAFVTHIFDSIVSVYGPLNYDNFAIYAHDVFVRDRPEIVRHAPRIFRMLNKSRTGVISFEEMCGWMARKLSSGVRAKPDAHLLATAMSLRLPLALLLDRRHEWQRFECALPSLSDGEEERY